MSSEYLKAGKNYNSDESDSTSSLTYYISYHSGQAYVLWSVKVVVVVLVTAEFMPSEKKKNLHTYYVRVERWNLYTQLSKYVWI